MTDARPQSAKLARRREYSKQLQAQRQSELAATGGHMTHEQARRLTDEIKHDAEALWGKIATAYTERAWAALGYESWDVYCIQEFGSLRLRLPREERAEMVTSLRHAGLSNRSIASATGISEPTVRRDQKTGASNDAADAVVEAEIVEEPPLITGTDGKTYPRHKPKPKPDVPKPSPITIPDTIEGAATRPESAEAEEKRLASVLLKYTNWFGQRLAEAQRCGMDVILSPDEADRLYTMLGDAVALVTGTPSSTPTSSRRPIPGTRD